MADFDPYHRWLQIPASEQPANHYRLLGLVLFESDLDVIENAANQRMAHLRTFQAGTNGPLSQQIMNEVTQAKLALLVPETKAAYDGQLTAEIAAREAAQAAAANPFTQLGIGDKPVSSGTKIEIPGELHVSLGSSATEIPPGGVRTPKPGSPQLDAPRPRIAAANRPAATLPKVVNRKVKQKTPAWILPVAIYGLLLFLLIGVGGVAAFFMANFAENQVTDIDTEKNLGKLVEEKKFDEDNSNKNSGLNDLKSQESNSETSHSGDSSGFEILDLFELPHNLHSGQAEITDAGLVLKHNPCINTVSIPVVLPNEYDLKISITGDGRAIVFGIPVNGHVAHLSIDTYNNKQTGLGGIDGIQIGARGYPGNAHIGQIIAEGTPTNLTISVREHSVKLFRGEVDGTQREFYAWTGDPARLSPHRLYETVEPYQFCPGISTYRGTEYTVHSLQVIPLGNHASDKGWLKNATIPPAIETFGGPVDLLSLYEDKFIIEKPVTPEGDGVEIGSASSPFAGTTFPYDLPEEYDVDMSVLNGGDRTLYISPMIAGKRSAIEVDNQADQEKKTFLSMIDSRPGGGLTYPGC
jgi:hypothetical protein